MWHKYERSTTNLNTPQLFAFQIDIYKLNYSCCYFIRQSVLSNSIVNNVNNSSYRISVFWPFLRCSSFKKLLFRFTILFTLFISQPLDCHRNNHLQLMWKWFNFSFTVFWIHFASTNHFNLLRNFSIRHFSSQVPHISGPCFNWKIKHAPEFDCDVRTQNS